MQRGDSYILRRMEWRDPSTDSRENGVRADPWLSYERQEAFPTPRMTPEGDAALRWREPDTFAATSSLVRIALGVRKMYCCAATCGRTRGVAGCRSKTEAFNE